MKDPDQQENLRLLALALSGEESTVSEVNPRDLQYVLYARKSTTGEDRQEKSIDHQVTDCIETVVKPLGINLGTADIIEERGSAKDPDIRPLFRQMIADLKTGKYQGLIAWHPDRLARNMKEAGEIIDLVDKKVIKDLQFATSRFENTPSGKMLLGISFVLSKQFSEHLSEQVSRGNRRKTEKGAFIGKYKHGYYKTPDGFLLPDEENFVIIQQALRMGLDKRPQKEILAYLESQKQYRVTISKEKRIHKWDKDAVSKLLRDPVYAGVLKYGDQTVILSDFYEFTPILTSGEFLSMNNVTSFDSVKISSITPRRKTVVRANLLRGIVYCSHCNKPMSSGITSKGGKSYYRYRCETSRCEMYNKGARAKTVTSFCINFLDEHRFTTRANYDKYAEETIEARQVKEKQLSVILRDLKSALSDEEKSYENAKRIGGDPGHPQAKYFLDDIEKHDSRIKELKKAITLAGTEKKALSGALLTYEKYLELFDNISVVLKKKGQIELLDSVFSKVFSKLQLEGEYVAPKNKVTRWKIKEYALREPYLSFIKNDNFVDGRGERTRTSGLLVPNQAR